MEMVINIPKEFESHFNNDKFSDSLGRLIFDLKNCEKNDEYTALSGLYDFETLEMLKDTLENATVIPKGHGRLIDADAFESRCMFDSSIKGMEDVIYALSGYEPIIEADKAESEG